ncbi:MAG TPA: CBS domain-containing protein [Noviherbaspirillum sp.]|uniref:CBS domain-containing protein n=1 Tax=Noviherbaspirillum sp. TaxID=1926288 RepID=UPI002B4668AC|nr:CBS domain-containing protein [Noviherbaspirillum sp.]HJV88623.1 CBS domain-containing protein [Noviherbaspirillum sp.]
MRVADAMSRDVRVANPDQSLLDAAKMMAEGDYGVLPVGENDRLVGMLTDRDIVVRGIAEGKTGDTKIRDVMSEDVKYCFEEDDLDDVARNMGDLQIRRLPVVNRDKRLTGIVSLGDISTTSGEMQPAGEALSSISEQGSQHAGSQARPH